MADQTFKPGDKALWKGGSYLVEVVSGPYECGGVEMYVYRLRSGNHGFGELESPDPNDRAATVAGIIYAKITNGVDWHDCQNKPMYLEWAAEILAAVLPQTVTDGDGDVWTLESPGVYCCGGLTLPLEQVASKFNIRGLSYE